jgi:5'-3' exonuclease
MLDETRETRVMVNATQEKVEAAISFIRSELEKTIRHQEEYVLACVDQRTRGLREELNAKMKEKKQELQMPLDMRIRSLREKNVDTKKDLREELDLGAEEQRST